VFQSDLLYDLVFALKCSYPFVHKHGLHDGFQYVIMIKLMRLTDFISCSHIWNTRSREFEHCRWTEKLISYYLNGDVSDLRHLSISAIAFSVSL